MWTGVFYLFRTNQVCISGKLNSKIDKPINIQNGVVLEEDTVWKCVFNLVYVHDNSKGKDRGLKNQGYMIT